MKANSRIIDGDGHIVEDLEAIFDLMQASSFDRACPLLTPIRKYNRGISGVERDRTPVTGILIVGLQLH